MMGLIVGVSGVMRLIRLVLLSCVSVIMVGVFLLIERLFVDGVF